MNRRTKKVCVPCRSVNKPTDGEGHCAQCGSNIKSLSYRWHPPKKNNDAAWKLIESGDWLWDKKLLARLSGFQQNRLAFRWEQQRENYLATTKLLQEINEVMSLKDMAKVFNSDVKHVKRWVAGGGVPSKLNWRIADLRRIIELVDDSQKIHAMVPDIREALWGANVRYRYRTYPQVLDRLNLLETYKEKYGDE